MACSTSMVSGRFQWTPARSLKPNLSAPCAPFLEPVSFTLSLRLLARSYRHVLLRRALAADLRILTRPPASVRPYTEPHSFCQDQAGLKPNRIELHAFPCCSAAEGGALAQRSWLPLPALFWQGISLAGPGPGPRLGGQFHHHLAQLL